MYWGTTAEVVLRTGTKTEEAEEEKGGLRPLRAHHALPPYAHTPQSQDPHQEALGEVWYMENYYRTV